MVVVWLEGEEVGEVIRLGWWWLSWGGRVRKRLLGFWLLFLVNFPFFYGKV